MEHLMILGITSVDSPSQLQMRLTDDSHCPNQLLVSVSAQRKEASLFKTCHVRFEAALHCKHNAPFRGHTGHTSFFSIGFHTCVCQSYPLVSMYPLPIGNQQPCMLACWVYHCSHHATEDDSMSTCHGYISILCHLFNACPLTHVVTELNLGVDGWCWGGRNKLAGRFHLRLSFQPGNFIAGAGADEEARLLYFMHRPEPLLMNS